MASFLSFIKLLMTFLCFFVMIYANPITPNNNCVPLYKQCKTQDKCCDGECQTVGRYQMCWSPPWGKRSL
ncbi:unnamed protein product [Rotaria sp. Silwood2]|nr:unnamed protein product [Rotaria sp. Silwood2]CAF3324873.1 unnamed protein product [Rotaria sp. Silwood2]CAF4132874.1 unnamed protein product [Rotaria sp. Silwood2]